MDPAQRLYLDGFAAGQRARSNGVPRVTIPITAIPEPAPPAGPPATFAERFKRELHPLDAYPRLLECAEANLPPDAADRFRFQWFGLKYLAPAQDGFRLRLRVPSGTLRTHQVRELAEIARNHASGCVELNADAGLDLRTITLPEAPEVLRRVEAAGFSFRCAEGESAIAVLTDSLAGMAQGELFDVTAVAARLEQCLWQGREFADLPRACRIVLSSGGAIDPEDCPGGDIHFTAQTFVTGSGHDGHAIGFRVELAGLGDLGASLRPDQVVHACLELLRLLNRGFGRSAGEISPGDALFATWDKEACLDALESSLGSKLTRSSSSVEEPGFDSLVKKGAWTSLRHRGVAAWPQKQEGLWAVGIALPRDGWLSEHWDKVADLADLFGCGRVRLSIHHAVLIPGVLKVRSLEEELYRSSVPTLSGESG
jgi:ferredoxin-nitrite reductase